MAYPSSCGRTTRPTTSHPWPATLWPQSSPRTPLTATTFVRKEDGSSASSGAVATTTVCSPWGRSKENRRRFWSEGSHTPSNLRKWKAGIISLLFLGVCFVLLFVYFPSMPIILYILTLINIHPLFFTYQSTFYLFIYIFFHQDIHQYEKRLLQLIHFTWFSFPFPLPFIHHFLSIAIFPSSSSFNIDCFTSPFASIPPSPLLL